MKYNIVIVLVLALNMHLYPQDCLRKFGGVKWIEKRLELEEYNKCIKEIFRDSNLEDTEERFAKYELALKGNIKTIYEIKGCKEITISLTIVFDNDSVDYDKVISTIHLMSSLFSLPDDRILEIDAAKLSDNSELLSNGEKIIINTMMIGGYDKHETSFQKSDGKFKVCVSIIETYIVGD